jgi:hypothetical protein
MSRAHAGMADIQASARDVRKAPDRRTVCFAYIVMPNVLLLKIPGKKRGTDGPSFLVDF